jgi:hypothetical protein
MLSAASDVLEMKELCGEIADRTAASHHLGSRVAAVVHAFKGAVTGNRAYEFLRGKALRVDSWEKDLARHERDRLRAEAERRDIARFIDRLASTRSYLETSDPDIHGPEIAALERALDAARRAGGPVAVSEKGMTE